MPSRPAEPGRTVHPAMTAAVLASLGDRSASGRTAERVAELLAAGRTAPERLHMVLVGELWASAGGPGLQRELARGGSTFQAEVPGVRLDAAGSWSAGRPCRRPRSRPWRASPTTPT